MKKPCFGAAQQPSRCLKPLRLGWVMLLEGIVRYKVFKIWDLGKGILLCYFLIDPNISSTKGAP